MSRPGYPKSEGKVVFGHGVYTDPSGTTYTEDRSQGMLKSYKDKVGGNTIGWPAVKHDNDYQATFYSDSSSAFNISATYDNGASYEGTWPSDQLVTPAGWNRKGVSFNDFSGNASALVTKLISRIQDRQINAAQFIVERQQTVRLVTSTARRLADAITSLKRGNFKHAAFSLTGNHSSSNRTGRAVGGIPEQWLALKYGWQPLLADIHGGCEELTRTALQEPPVLSVYASHKTVLDYVEEVAGTDSGDNNYFPQIKQYRADGAIHGSGYMEFKLSSDFGQTLSRSGFTNPYNLAWEELPYSFVVDWFVPVGNYLSLLDYESGLVFSRGYISQKAVDRWTSQTTRGSGKLPSIGIHASWYGGPVGGTVTLFKRSAFLGSPPVPPPRFKNPFSLTHVANALSLLATGFDRPKGMFNFMK